MNVINECNLMCGMKVKLTKVGIYVKWWGFLSPSDVWSGFALSGNK